MMTLPQWFVGTTEEAGFLRLVLNHVSDCLVAVDTSGTIVLINEPYCQLLEGRADDFLGRHITEVVGPETRLHLVAQGMNSQVGYPLEVRGHKLVTKQVPVYREGAIIGAVGLALFSDFEALKKTYSRISRAELAIPQDRTSWQSRFTLDDIIGKGERMDEYRRLLALVARYELPVLLSGETGSGKELAAHAIHASSDRAAGPFVWVNCASIPGELIEAELFGYEGAFSGRDWRHAPCPAGEPATRSSDERDRAGRRDHSRQRRCSYRLRDQPVSPGNAALQAVSRRSLSPPQCPAHFRSCAA
jgi:transcriptional regulator with PAS, ATPase and Fis domain